MALRTIRLNAQLKVLRSQLEELETEKEAIASERKTITDSFEEIENKEDLGLLEQTANDFETREKDFTENYNNLSAEIVAKERELEEINTLPEPEEKEEVKIIQNEIKRSEPILRMANKFETRDQMQTRLMQPEVREFYSKVKDAIQNRAITGGDLTLPTYVVDMIQLYIEDWGNIYPEVTVIRRKGDTKFIYDTDIPEAQWLDCCSDEELKELLLGVEAIELMCNKVGGFVLICNDWLKDSDINLVNYIETRIAQAIVKALENAIINGDGVKKPIGIKPQLTATSTTAEYSTFMGNFAGFGATCNIIAVMTRDTYWTRFATQNIATTSAGQTIMPSYCRTGGVLPDGTRVVFTEYLATDEVILGDFKKYILLEREAIRLESSQAAYFLNDKTAFKGVARYDGAPIKPTENFKLLTITG